MRRASAAATRSNPQQRQTRSACPPSFPFNPAVHLSNHGKPAGTQLSLPKTLPRLRLQAREAYAAFLQQVRQQYGGGGGGGGERVKDGVFGAMMDVALVVSGGTGVSGGTAVRVAPP